MASMKASGPTPGSDGGGALPSIFAVMSKRSLSIHDGPPSSWNGCSGTYANRISCRTGMLVTVRPVAERKICCSRSPDVFCLLEATSNAGALAGGCPVWPNKGALDLTTASAATTRAPQVDPRTSDLQRRSVARKMYLLTKCREHLPRTSRVSAIPNMCPTRRHSNVPSLARYSAVQGLAIPAAKRRCFPTVDASADLFALAEEHHTDMIGTTRVDLAGRGAAFSMRPH